MERLGLTKPAAGPQPHQQAGLGRQELNGVHARCPQVAPSRLGAELRALSSAGQNRRERGAEAQPGLVDLAQAAVAAAAAAAARAAAGGGDGGGTGGAARTLSCHPRLWRPPAPPASESALGFAAPAAPARPQPGRRKLGPARPRVRRCPRAGAAGRPGRCLVPGPWRRPPWR